MPETEKKPRKLNRKVGVFNTPNLKLDHPPIPGYHLAWINDERGKIESALSGGYEFVEESRGRADPVERQGGSSVDGRVRRLVGIGDSGNPMYAYLMKLEEAYYDEDIAESDRRSEGLKSILTRSRFPGSVPDSDRKNFYHPKFS